MKIRGPRNKPAQNRAFQPADILALAADHGAAGICNQASPACERALRASQRASWWPGNVENRKTIGARIADADVERCLDGMIAHFWCVMGAAAESRNARTFKSSLRPETPLIINFALLNGSSPRAIDRRWAAAASLL